MKKSLHHRPLETAELAAQSRGHEECSNFEEEQCPAWQTLESLRGHKGVDSGSAREAGNKSNRSRWSKAVRKGKRGQKSFSICSSFSTLPLAQCFSSRSGFCSPGDTGNIWRHSWLVQHLLSRPGSLLNCLQFRAPLLCLDSGTTPNKGLSSLEEWWHRDDEKDGPWPSSPPKEHSFQLCRDKISLEKSWNTWVRLWLESTAGRADSPEKSQWRTGPWDLNCDLAWPLKELGSGRPQTASFPELKLSFLLNLRGGGGN